MSSVNGKVALITGGARGVGAEVARRLHAKGAKVVLTDLDEAPLKELAAELGEDRVLTDIADVRDLGAMQAAVVKGIDQFGEAQTLKFVPDPLPRMDAEVAALGRSMSARTEAVEKR